MVHRILIVTAVAAEADSVSAGLGLGDPGLLPLPGGLTLRRHRDRVDVLVGGVGPAAVAAATGTALAHEALTGDRGRYGLVVSAGIAGGFLPAAPVGSVVVSSAIVAADLGAETPDGYLAVEELGFGRSVHHVPEALTDRITTALTAGSTDTAGPDAGTPDAGTPDTAAPGTTAPPYALAPVLTVSTVTGTARRAAELAERHPTAAAEAMEGFGVAEAAAAHGVPVVEIRAVSNAVGPRDRAAWRIGEALGALRHTFELLSRTVLVEPWEPS
ncbi:futalosine hydrolase [Streptomyces tanashiensis]|uniref:Futalosine hydrolase n=1 Tax=Streptomyces tanashiensis TaxID=67367 RepID=A0ABY6R1A0_9ACTN|nr:futalosine hydrolase [Streptomyces tanashiensis]UZX22484.1 futalosine hydrolase [Streptomyces tanashiensis]GGY59145.1 Futalosine hydrolase [Streptomyces tanashiensis]